MIVKKLTALISTPFRFMKTLVRGCFHLFRNQLDYAYCALRKVYSFAEIYFHAMKLDWANFKLACRSNVLLALSETKLTSATSKNSSQPLDEKNVRISFYCASRKKNNPNCHMELFLQSLLEKAHELSLIEVLIAIDKDDQIDYFYRLKKIYGGSFIIKIIVSPTRYGYTNLHLYDKELFKHISPHTKMLCDFSDDCMITRKNFDQELLRIDASHPDNIYFIHTRDIKREDYLHDVTQEMLVLFWSLQAREPASFFPIFSKHVLDIAQQYAEIHDTDNEWSPLCNTWICDCYIDILSIYVKKYGCDRIHNLDMIYMNPNKIPSPHQRTNNQYKLTANNLAFIKMLNSKTQYYLADLGKVIADTASTHMEHHRLV